MLVAIGLASSTRRQTVGRIKYSKLPNAPLVFVPDQSSSFDFTE